MIFNICACKIYLHSSLIVIFLLFFMGSFCAEAEIIEDYELMSLPSSGVRVPSIWRSGIVYQLRNIPNDTHKDIVSKVFNELRAASGIGIEERGGENFQIIYTNNYVISDEENKMLSKIIGVDDFFKVVRHAKERGYVCHVRVKVKDFAITGAAIVVDKEKNEDEQVTCVIRGMASSMGLFFGSRVSDDAYVFGRKYKAKYTESFLTCLDRVLISLLYGRYNKDKLDGVYIERFCRQQLGFEVSSGIQD